jgi:hypothetical protein
MASAARLRRARAHDPVQRVECLALGGAASIDRQPRRLDLEDLRERGHRVGSLEWMGPRQELVHHRPERKDIGASVHFLAADLFRRHAPASPYGRRVPELRRHVRIAPGQIQDFTPLGVRITFSGFKSRWTILIVRRRDSVTWTAVAIVRSGLRDRGQLVAQRAARHYRRQ